MLKGQLVVGGKIPAAKCREVRKVKGLKEEETIWTMIMRVQMETL